jgi:hypothetical protein
MADFTIKPASGIGNKLILQTQAETDVMTTSDSGVTLASATLDAPTITDLSNVTGTLPVGVTGGSGLTALGTVASGTLGSAVVFPAGAVVKHQKVLTAISSYQVGSRTYADITGSSITYTPATGADYIVYECSFVSAADAATNPLFAFKFLIDGTITKNQDSYAPYLDGVNGTWSSIRQTHKMVYSASGWTSGKVVKMQFRRYSSGNSARLHFSAYDYLTADGSTMGNTDRLTDVITTIYSVMA